MQLNFSVWLSSLDNFSSSRFIEGCALLFPLVDKAAKARRRKDTNRNRISGYIIDELEKIIALGTGIDIEFAPGENKKIILGEESIGEIFYRIRCSVVHEAETPDSIVFTDQPGVFEFGLSETNITVPKLFCVALLFVVLASPEYSNVPSEFIGRKIRFGQHEIMPSQCVGNYDETRKQLLCRVQNNG